MPAKSERQRKAAGAALAAKRQGKKPKSKAAQQMTKMSKSKLRDFAKKGSKSQ